MAIVFNGNIAAALGGDPVVVYWNVEKDLHILVDEDDVDTAVLEKHGFHYTSFCMDADEAEVELDWYTSDEASLEEFLLKLE